MRRLYNLLKFCRTEEIQMTDNEKEYKAVITRVGIVLLLFLLFFNVGGIIVSAIAEVLNYTLDESVYVYVITEILSSAVYLLSFLLSAFIFRKISSGKTEVQPLRLNFRLPLSAPLVILAGISLILAAAYVNSFLFSAFFGSGNVTVEAMAETTSLPPYAIVLSVMSTALVPALGEEFLFRGTILSNLMPYGKTGAIIGSAILFGLMHQNAQQIFYATASGILLGYVYVKTGSIWCGTLIHFFNNAFGVLETVILSGNDVQTATKYISNFVFAVFALGALSLLYFAVKAVRRAKAGDPADGGSFGKMLETTADYASVPIEPTRRSKLFWAPPVVVFAAISVVEMILRILLQ